LALITDIYEEVTHFYGDLLRFPVVEQWNRANARGVRYNLGDMRLEVLDNQREREPLTLGDSAVRFQVVVEVGDIEEARARIDMEAPPTWETSWGARLFQLQDPDGVPVTFLEWSES
jgi:catechol 2,3-dioxygenase-like lactoylglutathione lyase family enzyme